MLASGTSSVLTLKTFKLIFKANLAQKPKRQYFENQGRFAHLSLPEFPGRRA